MWLVLFLLGLAHADCLWNSDCDDQDPCTRNVCREGHCLYVSGECESTAFSSAQVVGIVIGAFCAYFLFCYALAMFCRKTISH